MTEKTVERRMLLRGAGVAGVSLAGVAATADTAAAHGRRGGYDGHRDSAVLGAWLIVHKDDPPGDPTPGTSVVTFAAGGAFASQDLAPWAPGGLGAWKAWRDRFKVNFWTASPAQGKDPAVTVNIQVWGKVWDDHAAGKYQGTVYEAKTKKVLQRFTGSFTGERVQA